MEWLNEVWGWLMTQLKSPGVQIALRVVAVSIGGLVMSKLLSAAAVRGARDLFDEQQRLLLRRAVSYGVLILAGLTVMRELGFDLNVLLGTAGILTVAVGFASQTSASNVISGLFLITERPFSIGDVIKIGETTGVVLSIDMISVKLRTFDNIFVRVPNESVLKGQVINYSRFPIRRFDLMLNLDYGEDLGRVRAILLEIAEKEPLCLIDPPPEVAFVGFGESAMQLRFSVWLVRQNYVKVRDTLPEVVKLRFDQEKILIPFPQRVISVRAGEALEVTSQPEALEGDAQASDEPSDA